MRKRFIVLVDLSEFAKRLLILANEWARKADAELLVVHQTFSAAPGMGEVEIRSEIEKQSRRDGMARLAAFVSDAKISGPPVKFHVTTSNPDSALLKLKATKAVDIVVVGVRNKSWFERIFMEGTAIKLVNELDQIVFALPDVRSDYDLSTLHVALKLQYGLNEAAFTSLINTNGGRHRKVVFISMIKGSEDSQPTVEYLQSLCSKYASMADASFEVIPSENSFSEIMKYMKTHEGILVIQKGHRNLVDIFRKYFVNDVLSEAQVPAIILP